MKPRHSSERKVRWYLKRVGGWLSVLLLLSIIGAGVLLIGYRRQILHLLPPHTSRTTVLKVLEIENPYARANGDTVGFTLTCTVFEGVACYFIDGDDAEQHGVELGDLDLEGEIVSELGWKYVEQSTSVAGDINSMTLQCSRAHGILGSINCQAFRGERWEMLPMWP